MYDKAIHRPADFCYFFSYLQNREWFFCLSLDVNTNWFMRSRKSCSPNNVGTLAEYLLISESRGIIFKLIFSIRKKQLLSALCHPPGCLFVFLKMTKMKLIVEMCTDMRWERHYILRALSLLCRKTKLLS